MESERIFGFCRSTNNADAEHCASCGATLDTVSEPGGRFVDDDPALRYVDPDNRIEVDRFERLDDEAELACGLLRFNGIACELSPLPLPGLPADIFYGCTTPMPNSHGHSSQTQSA